MSFINYTPQGSGYFADMANSQFVGLDWFKYFFSTDFTKIMRNTLATSLLTLLFSFPLPIILALCLNEVRNQKAKKFVQTASYIPYFISWVIAANIFLTFLSSDGVINNLLKFFGLTDESILFFQKGPYFWWIIAIANAWKVLGYNAIIYMAAISGISQDMYEAADVDGATRMQKILHITLPALKPTIMILLILAIGGVLNTGYEQQLLMSNDAILNYSDVLDTYAYRYGLKNGMYSYGTAVGFFKSAVSFILVISANALSKKFSDDNTALFRRKENREKKTIKIQKENVVPVTGFLIFQSGFLVLVTVICVYPFWNIFVVSINDATDALRGGLYFLPRKLSLASYKDILGRATFLHGILITVLRTAIGTPLAVLVTTALAYVLSRKELLFRKQLNLFFIFTMYFGGGMVPYYMVLKSLGMLNNFIVFIFPNLVSVYNMILVKNYIEGMPAEIFESAKIDGANDLTVFFKMVIPLSKPIIMTIALFVAITHWNSWFDAYLFTNAQYFKNNAVHFG